MAESLVYSVAEAAAVLGISESLAYRRIRTGELPCRRIGARIVVPRAALLRWLEDVA